MVVGPSTEVGVEPASNGVCGELVRGEDAGDRLEVADPVEPGRPPVVAVNVEGHQVPVGSSEDVPDLIQLGQRGRGRTVVKPGSRPRLR